MHLNFFIVLLLTFFTKGHSLQCYQCGYMTGSCKNPEKMTCVSENQKCSSSLVHYSAGVLSDTMYNKGCADVKDCSNGSLNLGVSTATSHCCDTDLCNSQDISDPSFKKPNGKQCYNCIEDICSYKVNCAGTEDYCIKAEVYWQSFSGTGKGCASKSMCDVISQQTKMVKDVSCCEGNLCNSAVSITKNLLILSWPFISFFIFH